ncbi:membrane protease YdiL (CAAX protease family) [Natronospira proteinivora]|uniref:Membrane protease YdiL (CAAX protease family) n=1 Tax=Natronospira proteinivora TaxID=1807133 RepID=A0ABT1G7N1_9GAMM|nr:type II CAAX endopeptidase family protein [Natronospira proteinivora]MCP1727316.1 membrane protease YdiL (CAAX protease family) [Natronospira proteinivora]
MLDPRGPQPLHAAASYFLMLLLAVLFFLFSDWTDGWLSALLRISAMQWASLLAILAVLSLAALSFRTTLRLNWPGPRAMAAGLFLGIGLSGFIAATLAHLYSLGEAADYAREVQQVLGEAEVRLGALTLLLVIVVLAPVAEELLFRGAVLSGLLASYPQWLAVALSTAMFAILHLHPAHFSITAVLGLICALTVLRLGSIWPAIVLHAAYNGSAMLMDILGFPEVLPLWTILPALAMMGTGVFLASRP